MSGFLLCCYGTSPLPFQPRSLSSDAMAGAG
jgi:hypothetical protein